jgi:hypothetical protein
MREFKEGITGEAKDDDKPALSEARAVPEARTMPEATPSSSEPAATPGPGATGSERS